MTTRFLMTCVLAVCLGGCAKTSDMKQWHPTCRYCGKQWTDCTLEHGYVTNEIRNHIDDCQRFKATHELIKVQPKLDSLP